jgi:hypothetical protein
VTDYQYTTVPGKLEELLSKIHEIGVPDKVTYNWLESIGFKSSNDRTLVRVLQFIDFIDESRKPTALWTEYRGRNWRKVLAKGIQSGYDELFGIYPDAHERSNEDLETV